MLCLYVFCCCQWESLLRVLFGLHFGCAAPLVSARMFVSLSLAVSASDSQQHPRSPCTISPLCASPTSLRIIAAPHRLWVLDSHIYLFFILLRLKVSPVFQTSSSFVSPRCPSNMCFLVVVMCSRTHLFFSDMLTHLKPFCVFLHGVCLSAVSLPPSFPHGSSWYDLPQTWVKILHSNV